MTHLKNQIKTNKEEEEKNAQQEYLGYNHSLFTRVYLTTIKNFTRVYLTLLTATVYAQSLLAFKLMLACFFLLPWIVGILNFTTIKLQPYAVISAIIN